MLGHHWESAEGKIVEVTAGPAGRYGLHSEYHYVVEVRTPAADMLRGTVIHKSSDSLGVGTLVRVQVNAKTREIRLDSSAGSAIVIGMSVADQIRASSADFDPTPSTLNTPKIVIRPTGRIVIRPGSEAVDLTGLLGGQGAFGDAAIRVIGPGGQDVAVDGSDGTGVS